VLASDCASMLLDSVLVAVPEGPCRLLSQLVAQAAFPANLAALQMLRARFTEELEVTDITLRILVSCLLKVRALQWRCKQVLTLSPE